MPAATDDLRLLNRIHWLIKLRWVAIICIIIALLFIHSILKLALPYSTLFKILIILVIYNLLFLISILILEKKGYLQEFLLNILLNIQISVDLFSVILIIHFTGGIENPFIFYFIFQMIIASSLLSKKDSFLQATYAVFLFIAMVFLEYTGIIEHYNNASFISSAIYKNPLYIAVTSFVFISTIYITVYMATSMSSQLKIREKKLNAANKQLKSKDRIKSEYVLRVSHDIKESLAAIQGCIEPVTAGILGKLNGKQSDLLITSRDRCKKLIFFVNALLEITKIKLNQSIEMQPVQLNNLIKDIAVDIAKRAKEKNLTFDLNIDDTVDKINGIKIYLEEAIQNLLVNAIKYTPSGGKISLSVKNKNTSYLITVKDTGIGIPEKGKKYIFQEFFRSDNAKEIERLGTGLGLSISKEIIDRHKGKIWFKSTEGEGTSFYIKLPYK